MLRRLLLLLLAALLAGGGALARAPSAASGDGPAPACGVAVALAHALDPGREVADEGLRAGVDEPTDAALAVRPVGLVTLAVPAAVPADAGPTLRPGPAPGAPERPPRPRALA